MVIVYINRQGSSWPTTNRKQTNPMILLWERFNSGRIWTEMDREVHGPQPIIESESHDPMEGFGLNHHLPYISFSVWFKLHF